MAAFEAVNITIRDFQKPISEKDILERLSKFKIKK